ncbi:hypothetical protein OOT46_02725 [Aquabacterium sp. A7-Y]|uniref:hypothetical protein n=1 Tax=Aquabacterium sp. A7-Y TaxID=1349605 RepID=UPI00223D59C8|nr:hypothetical protein [Aquabacterium sp. A7-Y]MCW7536767.1 hypothetical protein [Aquabacterium sp. A7-Y]
MRRTQHLRPSLRTTVWMWLVAAVLVLQSAMPLLATLAARQHGWALAEICTLYGVRTIRVDQAPSDDHQTPLQGQHASESQCALAALLGGAPLPPRAAPVHLHAPQQAVVPRDEAPLVVPLDASRRWLAGRLHAPPVQG